jgi:hypothetical protein
MRSIPAFRSSSTTTTVSPNFDLSSTEAPNLTLRVHPEIAKALKTRESMLMGRTRANNAQTHHHPVRRYPSLGAVRHLLATMRITGPGVFLSHSCLGNYMGAPNVSPEPAVFLWRRV